MALSQERLKEHLTNYNSCPMCASTDLTADTTNCTIDDNDICIGVKCNMCASCWVETYTLSSVDNRSTPGGGWFSGFESEQVESDVAETLKSDYNIHDIDEAVNALDVLISYAECYNIIRITGKDETLYISDDNQHTHINEDFAVACVSACAAYDVSEYVTTLEEKDLDAIISYFFKDFGNAGTSLWTALQSTVASATLADKYTMAQKFCEMNDIDIHEAKEVAEESAKQSNTITITT